MDLPKNRPVKTDTDSGEPKEGGTDSTALVPVEPVEVVVKWEDDAGTDPAVPEAEALIQALPPRPRAYLQALRETGTHRHAADVSGISRQAHRYWMGKMERPPLPGYEEAYEAVRAEIDDAAEALLYERVVDGLEEERRDADGNLMFSRIRHDSALMKMYLQGRMPEKYGREGSQSGSPVQINVVFRDE